MVINDEGREKAATLFWQNRPPPTSLKERDDHGEKTNGEGVELTPTKVGSTLRTLGGTESHAVVEGFGYLIIIVIILPPRAFAHIFLIAPTTARSVCENKLVVESSKNWHKKNDADSLSSVARDKSKKSNLSVTNFLERKPSLLSLSHPHSQRRAHPLKQAAGEGRTRARLLPRQRLGQHETHPPKPNRTCRPPRKRARQKIPDVENLQTKGEEKKESKH